jgi:deoxyribonuclease IV
MFKIGLKLWTTNLHYIQAAQDLFARKVFDYIELFTVPGSLDTILRWKETNIPCVLHAPHSFAGLNPADPSKRDSNMKLVRQVDEFFRVLSPVFVIFHPGLEGDLKEAISQLQSFGDRFPEMYQKVVIENKPQISLRGENCLGASPTEMRSLLDNTRRGLCLDFGHAICYSVAVKRDWRKVIDEFLAMNPVMYHLCDGFLSIKDAHEHLGSGEFDLPYLIRRMEQDKPVSLETRKDSMDSLDDFIEDVRILRQYAGI